MSAAPGVPHIPVLRYGAAYDSLDQLPVLDHRGGEPVALVSQANPGIIRRDLKKLPKHAARLREIPIAERFAFCARAAELFLDGNLPLNESGATQSRDEYIATLSRTSGMPHALCARNMEKIAYVLREMPTILRGLTRGMDPAILDAGVGHHDGVPVSFATAADGLGVVLPSNSPGVNSIWIPSLALGTPVILKPGREEPWTPLRIIRALIAGDCPKDAFGFYPTTHEGAATILESCQRSCLFGDQRVTAKYSHDPRVQIHGPGRSKVLIGADVIDDWKEYLDVLVDSVGANGGRSCINASAIYVPRHGDEIAEALARRLVEIEPLPADDPNATLCAFANPQFADFIDGAIERGVEQGGAEDITARFREGPRRVEVDSSPYLRPTVVRCQKPDHPLANTEFLFPFTSVVELPPEQYLETMGYSLVVTAITRDEPLRQALLRSPDVERLNLGPLPTTRVDWDQPHEGNLFEFLYIRRAIARDEEW